MVIYTFYFITRKTLILSNTESRSTKYEFCFRIPHKSFKLLFSQKEKKHVRY